MASKFLDDIRRQMRLHGYSLKTEKAYLYWINTSFICTSPLQYTVDVYGGGIYEPPPDDSIIDLHHPRG
ncbi:hypothetical protein ACODM8_10270 [Vibrio ostreicida]|uniref:hypothetical protein n=1 Tax=Vibrio ostreicida TaxID=526588 RepID=UPI003B5BEEE7